MKCDICLKEFKTDIDRATHMLFVEGVNTESTNHVDPEIKRNLKKRLDKADAKLSELAKEANRLGRIYGEYIDKIRSKLNYRIGMSVNSEHNTKTKRLWNEYQLASDKHQKQIYVINSILREIESYGLREEDL